MSMTTQVVDVRALQKSLNQASRDQRIELIRAKGDPKFGAHRRDGCRSPGAASAVGRRGEPLKE